MIFAQLPPRPPLNPAADVYGETCLARSAQVLTDPALRAAVSAHLNLCYGDDAWQTLDVYTPASASRTDLPVLVFFHGGGWTHGYKEWCGFMAPALVSLPCVFVSVSYRLLPEANFPAPFDDAYAALAWVSANIARFGGSPDRIHLGGHSAGGQLASTLAVREDERVVRGLPGDGVKGCFCISTTFNRRVVNEHIAPHLVTGEAPDEVSPSSSLAFAHQSRVPFIITWGGQENPRYDTFSRLMVERLRKGGCPVSSHRFDARGHFDIHLATAHPDDLWTRAVRHFMQTGNFLEDFEHE